jgi:hypothetical protein
MMVTFGAKFHQAKYTGKMTKNLMWFGSAAVAQW